MGSDRAADIIDQVVQTIYQRFNEPLTIEEMARTARYSRFHFSRLFAEVIGVPPSQFLTTVRIQEAKRLLLSTSLSVQEITDRVGYSCAGTLSARFKERVGMSPRAYRASARRPHS